MNDFVDEIAAGRHDDDLNDIMNAVRVRKDRIASSLVNSLNVGDTVLVKNCNPKLLIGKRGIVESVHSKRIQVRMPHIPNHPKLFKNLP